MKHNITTRHIDLEEKKGIDALYNEHRQELELYIELLAWWNKKINLVSRDVSHETLRSHVKHSLTLSLVSNYDEGRQYIDAGSGGGLPAIPLAITHEGAHFIVNDIVEKKMFAVRDMINKLKLTPRVQAIARSIADVDWPNDVGIVTKHAFKVDELLNFLGEKEWGSVSFLKGYEECLEELGRLTSNFDVAIIRLDKPFMGEFYVGKAVVHLTKTQSI